MNIQEMHFDFLRKMNKVTSNQNRSFQIPEIDFILNEAQVLFIKTIAEPRISPHPYLGVEKTQRSIDDLRTLITKSTSLPSSSTNVYTLPDDYMYFIHAEADLETEECGIVPAEVYIQQHGDRHEISPFDKSSYIWRELNASFVSDGIRVYPEDFTVSSFRITYIKDPIYMHFASGFRQNGYNRPGGTTLSGTADCELPSQVHSEIVDLAVLLAAGDISSPDFQIKMAKLRLNNLI